MTRRTKGSAPTAEATRAPLWLLALLLVAALAGVAFYKQNTLSNWAQDHAQKVAVASAGVYVTLRSINAFLSAAQEVEVGGSLVVSGTVQPLKTLEPLDDTIERIASVIFATMVVTGLLAVAMGPVGAVGAGMVALALGIWIGDRLVGRRDMIVVLARRLTWYGVFLALAVPAAFVLSSLIADRLTQEVWDRNDAVVQEIAAPLDGDSAGTDGLTGRIWAAMEGVDDYRALAGNIYDRADDLIGSYIAILAVFLFKVLVLPALLLGGFFLVARFFAREQGAGSI